MFRPRPPSVLSVTHPHTEKKILPMTDKSASVVQKQGLKITLNNCEEQLS